MGKGRAGKRHWRWKDRIKKICSICGKEFKVKSSDIKRGKGKFCSPKCWGEWLSKNSAGKNNPCWKGGKSFEPYSTDWTETLRISIRERDKYACQLCGKKQGDRAHSVHHIDYNKENCDPKNLITLCTGCNSKVNTNREYWEEYFKL